MRKKLSTKELAEIRKKEFARKELEYDLHTDIESEYRFQEKYQESGRLINFISGASIGFILLFTVNRFVFGNLNTIVPIASGYTWLIVLLKFIFVFLTGYYNMITMGKFVKQAKDFIKGFFR